MIKKIVVLFTLFTSSPLVSMEPVEDITLESAQLASLSSKTRNQKVARAIVSVLGRLSLSSLTDHNNVDELLSACVEPQSTKIILGSSTKTVFVCGTAGITREMVDLMPKNVHDHIAAHHFTRICSGSLPENLIADARAAKLSMWDVDVLKKLENLSTTQAQNIWKLLQNTANNEQTDKVKVQLQLYRLLNPRFTWGKVALVSTLAALGYLTYILMSLE